MDASKDSMNVTHNLLSRGVVKGADCLPVKQLVELLDRYVALATPQLRQFAVPSMIEQIAGDSKGLPIEWQQRRAVLVCADGSDAWSDTEAEYWFVDRDKMWYWIKNDRFGRNIGYAQVTSRHLVGRQVKSEFDGLAPIRILGLVADSFANLYSEAAVAARRRASDFEAAASKMSSLGQTVGLIRNSPSS